MLSKIHDSLGALDSGPAIDLEIVDSKRLQMFYIAAKEGGFALAAHVLGLSPSAVSHAIKGLEEDLGCSLFRRSGPQVTLTRSGAQLLPMVEELLGMMSRMKGRLSGLDGRSENLSLLMPPALMGILGFGILPGFRECFPNSLLEVVLDDGNQDERGMDLRIGYERNQWPELVRRDLGKERLLACVAPFHPFARREAIRVEDFKQTLLICPDREIYETVVAGVVRRDRMVRCWIMPNPESARELARQGQGVAILPDWSARAALEEGSLKLLAMPELPRTRVCSAYWRAESPLSWVGEAFLSLVAMEFEKRVEMT